jgi:hypothetical protein
MFRTREFGSILIALIAPERPVWEIDMQSTEVSPIKVIIIGGGINSSSSP